MQENIEHQYLQTMASLLDADAKEDRTGTGTFSMFGHQMRHDMRTGFPLLTTKNVFFKGVAVELLWFLQGDTNIKFLNDNGVHIWDEWSTEEGELGPVYGRMWRDWNGEGIFDQIADLVLSLQKNPTSRRHVVSAWNPEVLPVEHLSPAMNAATGQQALPPCHTLFQVNCQEIPLNVRVSNWSDQFEMVKITLKDESDAEETHRHLDSVGVPRYYIDLQLYQRSADWFLGVPFNIASYALLLQMLGAQANMVPRYFVHSFGDYHLYKNHIEQAKKQLSREPGVLPSVELNPEVSSLIDYTLQDIRLVNYEPQGAIKAPVSV